MDPLKRFTARSLSSPANPMLKAKDPVVEESNSFLQSSLSIDCKSGNRAMEKEKQRVYADDSLSMKPTHVSLELTLSLPGGCNSISISEERKEIRVFEVGDCSYKYQRENHSHRQIDLHPIPAKNGGPSLELTLGFNDVASCSGSKERPESELRSASSSSCNEKKRKWNKVAREEEIMTELRLGPPLRNDDYDRWRIRKKLRESDIGNLSRLLLASKSVKSHVFPYWNAHQKAQIENGLPVSVRDCDTNSEHELVFKQWNNGGANVLIKNWVTDFVKRRKLKSGDEIGLYWDEGTSEFNFAVLKRYAGH